MRAAVAHLASRALSVKIASVRALAPCACPCADVRGDASRMLRARCDSLTLLVLPAVSRSRLKSACTPARSLLRAALRTSVKAEATLPGQSIMPTACVMLGFDIIRAGNEGVHSKAFT